MTAIVSLNDLVNRQTGGNSGAPEAIYVHKEARVAGAAAAVPIIGQMISLWEFEGSPSHGAVPAAGTFSIPDNTTPGGIRQTDPAGGRQKWLTSLFAGASQAGTYILYDRLLHISGFSGTNTGAQNLNGGSAAAPTRYTNGLGNIIFAEIYTQIGVTATTITAAYANTAAASKTTQATVFGATNRREAQRAIFLSLAAGDQGVESVTSATVLASTTTAGNFGIVVAHPLAIATVGQSGGGTTTTFLDGPIPEILTDACLALLFIPAAVTAMTADLFTAFVES